MRKHDLLASMVMALAFAAAAMAAPPDASIETTFDRNKGKLYAEYRKALREQPGLKGRVDLEFTVSTLGKASGCRVVRDELPAPQLVASLCDIVEAMSFDARKAPTTVTKPLTFFPVG